MQNSIKVVGWVVIVLLLGGVLYVGIHQNSTSNTVNASNVDGPVDRADAGPSQNGGGGQSANGFNSDAARTVRECIEDLKATKIVTAKSYFTQEALGKKYFFGSLAGTIGADNVLLRLVQSGDCSFEYDTMHPKGETAEMRIGNPTVSMGSGKKYTQYFWIVLIQTDQGWKIYDIRLPWE